MLETTEWWAATVTIANDSTESFDYSGLSGWSAEGTDASHYNPAILVVGMEGLLGKGTLQPAQTVKGYLPFELPKGTQLTAITFSPFSLWSVHGDDVTIRYEETTWE